MAFRLFDAHCHLQDERLADDTAGVLSRARAAGVERVLCCGSREQDWPAVAALARAWPAAVVPAFGLHPWYAHERSAEWLTTLRAFLEAQPNAAVGEIGLDHALPERHDAEQGAVFLAQVRLARELGRPVSVHCRRAWEQLLQSAGELRALPRGFVIHSYSGGPVLLEPLAQLGAVFSFSGTLTWSRNRKAHEACRLAPAERLVLETDAPDLPPAGAAGGRLAPNEPANLRAVAEQAAALRNTAVERLAELTWQNACRCLL